MFKYDVIYKYCKKKNDFVYTPRSLENDRKYIVRIHQNGYVDNFIPAFCRVNAFAMRKRKITCVCVYRQLI